MAGKKEPGAGWRQIPVLVRADIYARALGQGIDINNICNQALADVLGIDYRQQKLGSEPVPPPVIIAKDGGLPVAAETLPAPHKSHLPPVINADDPKAAGSIVHSKKLPVRKPAPEIPAQKTGMPDEKSTSPPVKTPDTQPARKSSGTAPKKTGKGDVLKKFISAKIIREDTDGSVIGKDEFYQVFSRWCREQKLSPVPDGKVVTVTLKNQFAFKEKVVEGRPCWVNVRAR